MSHYDGAAVAAGIHAAFFGESVTYTAPGGTSEITTAIVHPTEKEQRALGSGGMIEVETCTAAFEFEALSEPPVLFATVDRGSDFWSVDEIKKDSARWVLKLIRSDFVEITRNNYRRSGR